MALLQKLCSVLWFSARRCSSVVLELGAKASFSRRLTQVEGRVDKNIHYFTKKNKFKLN